MKRRQFLTGGISLLALSRMAKAAGDSPFFRGNVPDGLFFLFGSL